MPRYDPIPVTKEIVTWARARAGFSVEQASEKFRHISDWEDLANQEALPTYPQLEKMADTFKVPVAVFFFPQPPDIPSISESFRTIPEAEFDALPSRVRMMVRKAKAFQINLEELSDGRNPSERLITRNLQYHTQTNIAEMAAEVREYLGVTMEEQTSWSNAENALKEWRTALQAVGVAVFKDSFDKKETRFSGFCLYDEQFPLIYVNNNNAKSRQIFTLFHELGHVLFHTSGIDGLPDGFIDHLADDGRDIEVLCNRFAAEFLVPDALFNEAVVGMPATEESAEALAEHFNVSRTFIYLRFLQRRLIGQEEYNEADARWTAQAIQTKGSGGNYYLTQLTYLGRDYVGLAFSNYYQNRIGDAQLADYLGIKGKNIAALERYFLKGA